MIGAQSRTVAKASTVALASAVATQAGQTTGLAAQKSVAIQWGNATNPLATTADTYLYLGFGPSAASATVQGSFVCALPGVLKNFYARILAGDAAKYADYWIFVNGANSTLTCRIAAAGTNASDTNQAHNVTVAAGDIVSVHCAREAGTTTDQTVVVCGVTLDYA